MLLTGLRYCLFFFILICTQNTFAQDWKELATPIEGDKWVQPAKGKPAQPVWGHKNGMRVGLSPLPGPRGLIRIYTPYLDHKNGRVLNFLALEPVVKGSTMRGLSELEMSGLDNMRGKRFWSANDSLHTSPENELFPASGIVQKIDGVETLTLFVYCEPFESGAKVYVRLRFYEDNPYEVEIKTYEQYGSKEMDNFIVTATMGNFARLRTLYLKDRVVSSRQLWPDYSGDAFTDHAHFLSEEFVGNSDEELLFIAAPNETNPSEATYAPKTADHWKYYGKKAIQYWKISKRDTGTLGQVNARYTYWASKASIPGGISFENFELKAPFEQGRKMVFGVSLLSPESFIKK